MNPPPIRVAVVEDSAQTRAMLVALLDGSPGFTCVAACETAEKAIQRIPGTAPDVVLMDLRLPGKSGAECLRALQPAAPSAAFMVLTAFDDPESLFGALQAGASGYLLKRTAPAEILEAIRELRAGGSPMTPEIARRVLDSLHDAPETPAPGRLTAREREVLTLAADGLTYHRIAERLGLSHGTIRTHFRNAYEKLHVRSLAEALQRVGLKPPARKPPK